MLQTIARSMRLMLSIEGLRLLLRHGLLRDAVIHATVLASSGVCMASSGWHVDP
jgi:hypothetical protein